MSPHDPEFDPDDNFANAFQAHGELDEEATTEALVWQLLLLINPGDEEAALQQFADYREAAGGDDTGDGDPAWRLRDVIDWKSGFLVDDADPATLMDVLSQLAARWNLRIDWGLEDPSDEAFLADADANGLVTTAYDRLREHGYTLWIWDAGADVHAGWITLRQDEEAMRAVAAALGIALRTGAG